MTAVVVVALLATLGYARTRSKLTKVASTSDGGNNNDNNEANANPTTAAEDHNGDANKHDDGDDVDFKPRVKYHLYDPGLFDMYTKCEARGSGPLHSS